jgi:sarcosine oxidase subunit gamma
LHASLAASLRGTVAAVTDVSDARIVYAVSGPNARHLLAKGCPLDLHERVFPAAACAQTLLAKVPVVLWRSGIEPMFDLHVARSVRDYAWAWLQSAAAEYALAAGGS